MKGIDRLPFRSQGMFSLVWLLLLALFQVGASVPFFYEDEFNNYSKDSDGSPTWNTGGLGWSMTSGTYQCEAPQRDFAILSASPWASAGLMEATLIVDGTTSGNWKTAGIGIYSDADNYWHLALVESPDSQGGEHTYEMAEMLNGRWLANFNGETALQSTETIDTNIRWQYGSRYRFKLDWDSSRIRGTVLDPKGVMLARFGFRFGKAPACRLGKPMLCSGGLSTRFEEVRIRIVGKGAMPVVRKTPVPDYFMQGFGKVKGERTGFFHVERFDENWWVVDPEGAGFYIIGTDHCNFNVHWCEQLGYAPYNVFCKQKYPNEHAWAENAVERLREWNFNSLGANNSPSTRHKGLAHTEFLSFGAGFAEHDDICPKVHWTGFPNVFNPRFRQYCRKRAERLCPKVKDDPWLLGYFIDNELEWFGKSHKDSGLCDEVFKKPRDHSSKTAFIAFLKERYENIQKFNEAWGTVIPSFETIQDSSQVLDTSTDQGCQDKLDFVSLIAERYFEITTSAIREFDPNHMVLGTRFAGRALPGVWKAAGDYCDIVSVNCYRQVSLETETFKDNFPEDLEQWYQLTQRPLMITECHGLPSFILP